MRIKQNLSGHKNFDITYTGINLNYSINLSMNLSSIWMEYYNIIIRKKYKIWVEMLFKIYLWKCLFFCVCVKQCRSDFILFCFGRKEEKLKYTFLLNLLWRDEYMFYDKTRHKTTRKLLVGLYIYLYVVGTPYLNLF